jgi:cation:H+ antiporter
MVSPAAVTVSPEVLWLSLPVMVGASLLCLPVMLSGHRIVRWEGLALLGLYVAYTIFLIMNQPRS